MPDHCKNEECAVLVSSLRQDTGFVVDHIIEWKLFVKVIWIGKHLKSATNSLLESCARNGKMFITLHWTPSEIIDADIEYDMITMPRCNQYGSERSREILCKYELTPILKYYSQHLKRENAPFINSALTDINFERQQERDILEIYNNLTQNRYSMTASISEPIAVNSNEIGSYKDTRGYQKDIYWEAACEWLRQNREVYTQWRPRPKERERIYIGGIFPTGNDLGGKYKGKKHAFRLF